MEQLEQNKAYFSSQMRHKSVNDVSGEHSQERYDKNSSVAMHKSIIQKQVTPTQNAGRIAYGDNDEQDMVEIRGDGSVSPGTRVARGGRGRSPTQPK